MVQENKTQNNLLTSVKNNNMTEVKNILDISTINIDQGDAHDITPLHWAVWNSNAEMVKILLKYKANPDKKNDCGYTPIQYAILEGDEELTQLLR